MHAVKQVLPNRYAESALQADNFTWQKYLFRPGVYAYGAEERPDYGETLLYIFRHIFFLNIFAFTGIYYRYIALRFRL